MSAHDDRLRKARELAAKVRELTASGATWLAETYGPGEIEAMTEAAERLASAGVLLAVSIDLEAHRWTVGSMGEDAETPDALIAYPGTFEPKLGSATTESMTLDAILPIGVGGLRFSMSVTVGSMMDDGVYGLSYAVVGKRWRHGVSWNANLVAKGGRVEKVKLAASSVPGDRGKPRIESSASRPFEEIRRGDVLDVLIEVNGVDEDVSMVVKRADRDATIVATELLSIDSEKGDPVALLAGRRLAVTVGHKAEDAKGGGPEKPSVDGWRYGDLRVNVLL